MAQVAPPELWTVRLAGLLGQDLSAAERDVALQQLSSTYVTGQSIVDERRKRILDLLSLPERQITPARESSDQSPPPIVNGMALPLLQALGTAGTSLVAIDQGAAGFNLDDLSNWLASGVAEIVLVDCGTTPALGERLRKADLADPRLRVVRLERAEVSWAQAFNIGFRVSRHRSLWAAIGEVRFGELEAALPDLPSGSFVAGMGVIALNRGDLAQVGGFNEYLETSAWGLNDLAGRLSALGLQRRAPPPGLIIPPQAPTAPTPDPKVSLRDQLIADPDYNALQNRIIAATMPDWTGDRALSCLCQDNDGLGLHVLPTRKASVAAPIHIKTEAARQALIDLLRQTVGGEPELMRARQMDLVLNRPALDVCPVDIAMAAGKFPDLVTSRRAWAVIDIAADALPIAGTPEAKALDAVAKMVLSQGQTLVLRPENDAVAIALDGLTSYPVLSPTVDATAFYPMELREMSRPLGERAPRHATVQFNRQFMADLQQLRLAGPTVLLRRPKIFVDAQHGLGNRLRTIASAGTIAKGTDRELVIIWQPDVHCACTYEDVFFPHGAVLSDGFVSEARSFNMDVFNYMEIEPDSAKDAPIELGAFRDVYLRSAYPFVHPFSNWHSENDFLRTIEHNHVVRALVNSVRNPNSLAVHIRMEGGTGAEHLPYESAANWTPQSHKEITHWRKRSHFRHFLPRLEQLIAQGQADTVFVAADTPAAYAEITARYGERISWLPRKVFDRSAQSVVYAMADAILLSRAPRLLGSNWSSFSELAARLSPTPMKVELSGRDF